MLEKSWRGWLLVCLRFIHRNSPSPTQRFLLPNESVVYLGGDIGIQFPKRD